MCGWVCHGVSDVASKACGRVLAQAVDAGAPREFEAVDCALLRRYPVSSRQASMQRTWRRVACAPRALGVGSLRNAVPLALQKLCLGARELGPETLPGA